jgi:RNA polymerase sigma-70 factor (ECF subfamily)
MSPPSGGEPQPRTEFERLIGELRPKLHRYCARMTGSVIDGEDVVQEALVKAIEAFSRAGPIDRPEGWLFRIAHNAALDFLRRRARQEAIHADEDLDMIPDPVNVANDRQLTATSLRTFMRLPVAQRSSVILMDVLGYSLDEISDIMGSSLAATKAALHRGRARLLELAREPDDTPPPSLSEAERAQLAAYVDRFNARDFDAIREMIADDVRLELVNRTRRRGRQEVEGYFSNYARIADWRLAPGLVDRRPALIVSDPRDQTAGPTYFILLEWSDGRIVSIRDFYFARYATEGAELATLG